MLSMYSHHFIFVISSYTAHMYLLFYNTPHHNLEYIFATDDPIFDPQGILLKYDHPDSSV